MMLYTQNVTYFTIYNIQIFGTIHQIYSKNNNYYEK